MEAKMEKLTHDVNGMLEYPGQAEMDEGILGVSRLSLGPMDYTLPDGIGYKVTLSNVGDAIVLTGRAWADIEGECVRCLEPARMSIESEVEGYFAISGESDVEGLETDEFEYMPEDGIVDLTSCVTSAILVEVPVTFLCRDDCKGLCPRCGCNLNFETCDCDQQYDESNPFYVLKDFFGDGSGEGGQEGAGGEEG